MNLLKIGNETYNLDTIVRFEDQPSEDRVSDYGHPFTVRARLRIHTADQEAHLIEGAAADTLRSWLARNSTDIAAENDTHAAIVGLAQELRDVFGAMEIADEAHAYELLTGLVEMYYSALDKALGAAQLTR